MAKLNSAHATGFRQWRAQLESTPFIEHTSERRAHDPLDAVESLLDALPAGDLFAVQKFVINATANIPECRYLLLRLADISEHPHGKNYRARGSVTATSDGQLRCVLPILSHISAGLEDRKDGELTCTQIAITLRGVPVQLDGLVRSAYQQVQAMGDVLAPKLESSIEGAQFQDENGLAQAIVDVIQSAKSELAEHLLVESIFVTVNLDNDEPSTLSDQDSNTATDLAVMEEGDVGGRNDSFTEITDDAPAKLSVDAHDDAHTVQDVPEEEVSTVLPGEMQAIALRQLIRELDSPLAMDSTSTLDQMMSTAADSNPSKLESSIPRQRHMQRGVVVALGSNVGNKIEEIEKACRAIDEDPDMRIVATSCLYESEPMYVEDQDTFVNGACEVCKTL